jgi:hypothetical protein
MGSVDCDGSVSSSCVHGEFVGQRQICGSKGCEKLHSFRFRLKLNLHLTRCGTKTCLQRISLDLTPVETAAVSKEEFVLPIPIKPCDGAFSEVTIRLLLANTDHAQWLPQPCERCGQRVGARHERGHWLPEIHWPSIPRRPSARLATNDRASRTGGGDEQQT